MYYFNKNLQASVLEDVNSRIVSNTDAQIRHIKRAEKPPPVK